MKNFFRLIMIPLIFAFIGGVISGIFNARCSSDSSIKPHPLKSEGGAPR